MKFTNTIFELFYKNYQENDTKTRFKVAFFLKVNFLIIGIFILILFFQLYNDINDLIHINKYLLGFEIFGFFVIFYSMYILYKGFLNRSIHILLNLIFIQIWSGMFFYEELTIARLDSIAFIYGILAITTLLNGRNKFYISLYTFLNIIFLAAFSYYIHYELEIPYNSVVDYFIDNTFGLILTSLILTNIFAIFKKAMEKEEEAERRILHSESEMKKLKNELEERVIDRNEMLNNQIQKQSLFINAFSHDLKTPLRGIAQISQWLNLDYKTKLTPAESEELNRLYHKVVSINTVIDSLLNYSEIKKPYIETVNIDKLLKSLTKSFSKTNKSIIYYPENLPNIKADRIQTERLFESIFLYISENSRIENPIIEISKQENTKEFIFSLSSKSFVLENSLFEQITMYLKSHIKYNEMKNISMNELYLTIIKKITFLHHGSIRIEKDQSQSNSIIFTLPKVISE